ncbi:MAG: Nif3-like dinuclear metal center hexameric protein, partial [Deltaproteobacteria bacterium]|nr:Nif3-like dinuclear metal center hexameric protein [Deltaproteobacteria bacterium]
QLSLQEKWDNSGYQLKLADEPVNGVLISLELTPEAVLLAVKSKCNLIITHHPFFFHPIKSIDINSSDATIINTLLNNKICVYSMHTNFDSSIYSMSRFIAQKINLKSLVSINPFKKKLYKLSVFVPKGYIPIVREALFKYADPVIGNYENCSFETKGRGSFKPVGEADPFIGEPEKTSFVDESKLEVIIEENKLGKTIEEIKKVHPYEEVAYDIYPLFDYGSLDIAGLGVIGEFIGKEKNITLQNVIIKLKNAINADYINYTGKLKRIIKKAAIISGSGFSYINEVIDKGADVFISSECSYHNAIKAYNNNLCLIDIPHFDSEKSFNLILKEILGRYFDIKIITNNIDFNPILNFKGDSI